MPSTKPDLDALQMLQSLWREWPSGVAPVDYPRLVGLFVGAAPATTEYAVPRNRPAAAARPAAPPPPPARVDGARPTRGPAPPKPGTKLAKLLEMLQAGKPVSRADLLKALETTPGALSVSLNHLKARGFKIKSTETPDGDLFYRG